MDQVKTQQPTQQPGQTASFNQVINNKYKTSRCRHFEQHGSCQMGEKCHFAHGDSELRSPNDPIPPHQIEFAKNMSQFKNPQNTTGTGNFSQNKHMHRGGFQGHHQNRQHNPQFKQQIPGQQQYNSMVYKTVECKFYKQNKPCPYKERCTFAHGETELRQGAQGFNPSMPPSTFANNMQMPLAMNYAAFNNMDPSSQLMMGAGAFGGDQSQFNQQPQFLLANPGAGQNFADQQQQLAAQAQMFNMQAAQNPLNMQAAMMMQQQQQHFQNLQQQNNQLNGAQAQQQNNANGVDNSTSGLTQGQSYTQITLNMKQTDPTTGAVIQKEQTLDVYVNEKSKQVTDQIENVTNLINQGNNEQAYQILETLNKEGKINLQGVGVGVQGNGAQANAQ